MKIANYLDQILIDKKQEVDRLIEKTQADPNHYLNSILSQNRPLNTHFSKSLKGEDLAVIAEIKRQSPSRGKICQINDPVELAFKYCQGGASSISIKTDMKNFGGSLDDLSLVASGLALQYPGVSLMRSDFIIHPLQLAEAVACGASAVLLLAPALGENLKMMITEARRLGLETLTEVQNLNDLELALKAEAPIIAVNHRDLSTAVNHNSLINFVIDLNLSEKLRPLIPSHIITVAKSGIHEPEQAKRMRELGYDAIFVGEALVRAKNPSQLIKHMKGENDETNS